MGNWHGEYEKHLESNSPNWLEGPFFIRDIKVLVDEWNRVDKSPPKSLQPNDWDKIPAKNWRIDRLVTWVALKAYREYASTYNHFKNGCKFNTGSMKNLTQIAVAMSVLALIKAIDDVSPLSLIEVLKKVGKQPPLSIPSGLQPSPKTESLKEIIWNMLQDEIQT
jgi:hypothetical protein